VKSGITIWAFLFRILIFPAFGPAHRTRPEHP
jgi:hypothetical protein